MDYDLNPSSLGASDAKELAVPPPPSRRLHLFAWLLCAVLATAAMLTGMWIVEREAESRLAGIERGLLGAEAHAARLVTLADAIMLPALWALDGQDPARLSVEQLENIRRVAMETAHGRFPLEIWFADGSSPLASPGASAAAREDFLFLVGAERDSPARAGRIDAQRRMLITSPIPAPVTGVATIHVSRPIIGADGAPRGLVSVAIPVDGFSDIYMALRDREGDRIALYRADRVRLVQYPVDGGEDDLVWRRITADPAGRFEWRSPDDGGPMLTLFCALDPLPLVVAYTAEWRVLTWRGLLAYWPILAVALATIAAAVVYAWMSIRYAAELHRSNGELARAKDALRQEANGRGIFIANMNHELRTPLNAIVGFAQILAGAMFGPLGHQKYGEYARDIVDSGRHLLMLIGDIIDFSSIDLGSRRLSMAPVDAGEAIEEMVRLLRPVAGERNVVLRADGRALWAVADPMAVRQILTNLVSNAIKFAPPGSVVDLACAADPSGLVALSVADRGPGIAPEELPSIGRPFYRTRASRDAAVPGTGLGLSISTALAHRMGGRLTLASAPGRGTTVTLLLPAAGAQHILPV